MRNIDPWKSFDNPNMTEVVQVLLDEDVNVRVGMAIIRNRTYAIPLIWDRDKDTYRVLAITEMLSMENRKRLSVWSQVGNYLRDRLRGEIIYLLFNGVANLDHSLRRKK